MEQAQGLKLPEKTGYRRVVEEVGGLIFSPRPRESWIWAMAVSLPLTLLLGVLIVYLLFTGVGVWGTNMPVAWAYPITNFVWWIGIGHAGTLISAILYLLRQPWRNSINRFAESMTLCALVCAGLFPALHVGRAWVAYWLLPYPNQMRVWPGFFSPLVWDLLAVSTYSIVSVLFWYFGLLPDLANLRVSARSLKARRLYGFLSLGFAGTLRQWTVYDRAYLILAGLATPLVFSVHSVVSFDFSVAQLPGWHSTIFPPYFVAGAIFSGLAMVLTLVVPARRWFSLESYITLEHLDALARLLLATAWMVLYSYLCEAFIAWYSANPREMFVQLNRQGGPYAPIVWTMLVCNLLVPQFLWLRSVRRRPWLLWMLAVLINVGMWQERYVIIVTSLHRDFLPSSWGLFSGTWIDRGMLLGSMGLFVTLLLLLARAIPLVSMTDVKELLASPRPPAAVPPPQPIPLPVRIWVFANPDACIAAARQLSTHAHHPWDARSPIPLRALMSLQPAPRRLLAILIFLGGLLGAVAGLLFPPWANGWDYPLIFSGKPYWGLPAHIPIAFELAILLASLTAFVAGLVLAGLPHFAAPAMHLPATRSHLLDAFELWVDPREPALGLLEDTFQHLGGWLCASGDTPSGGTPTGGTP